MLPDINLDDEEFENIVEEARNKVMEIYPEWTDFNYHDPGITLIELFAWIKENQQYYLNQTGLEMKLKFLKLLGIRPEQAKPASAVLAFKCLNDRLLLKGTKIYAGNICFETLRRKQLTGSDISCMLSVRGKEKMDMMDHQRLSIGQRVRFYPFGTEPQINDACLFFFQKPLPAEMPLSLYLDIWEEYAVKRNRLNGRLRAPLAVFAFQYYTETGWETVEDIKDQTYGFLQDGFVSFSFRHDMAPVTVVDQTGYCIQVVLTKQQYDVPPCITRAGMNMEEAVQRDTLAEYGDFSTGEGRTLEVILETALAAEGKTRVFYGRAGVFKETGCLDKQVNSMEACVKITVNRNELPPDVDTLRIVNQDTRFKAAVIGSGTGLPWQRYELEETSLEYASFELMISDQGGYLTWEKVDDFCGSKADDRHYRLDTESGSLFFGDGIHGRMPVGQILIFSCASTRGMRGNVKENTINSTETDIQVTNIENAAGGRDMERIGDCQIRGRKAVRQSGCAVTDRDYERRIMETPGLMIEACKVLPLDGKPGNLVSIAVKPFHMEKRIRLGAAYEKNIRAYLEQYRLIGTNLRFLQPEYIPAIVTCQIIKNSRYTDAGSRIRNTLTELFRTFERSFGLVLSYGALYGILDRLPCVSSIRFLSVSAKSSRVTRLSGGDLALPPNGLIYLKEINESILTDG